MIFRKDKKERVFCGECVYFKDSNIGFERKCLFRVTIRTQFTYKEKKDLKCYAFPQLKNERNDCKDFKGWEK